MTSLLHPSPVLREIDATIAHLVFKLRPFYVNENRDFAHYIDSQKGIDAGKPIVYSSVPDWYCIKSGKPPRTHFNEADLVLKYSTSLDLAIKACETSIRSSKHEDEKLGRCRAWTLGKLESGNYIAEIMTLNKIDEGAPMAWWTARAYHPAIAMAIATLKQLGSPKDWEKLVEEACSNHQAETTA